MQEKQLDYLEMKFDPTTIEHLGVQMYSTLPPVIAELVSNSYDADAKEVKVFLHDLGEKLIVISDDGHGMSFDEVNAKFLKIGRNRRKNDFNELKNQKSESGKRNVIGKKGIGKLSFFGIAKKVNVATVRDGLLNEFELDWDSLVNSKEKYRPDIIGEKNQKTTKPNGTVISIKNISRKSAFDADNIAYNLAKTFSIFDEPDFKTLIFHNNGEPIEVKNEFKFRNIKIEFCWDFPVMDFSGDNYRYSGDIKGKIISAEDTVPASLKGISLFSRGKLVNVPEFYDQKATSFGYSYITGWLDVSFIDNWEKDIISTDRKSLNWEDEDAFMLRSYLNSVISYIYKEQRKKRKAKQIALVQKIAGINLEEWENSLPSHERVLSQKMTTAILNSEGIPTGTQAELVKYVKDSFQFEAFKNFAIELDEVDYIDSASIIRLMKEWELIERREMYKLALGRVETIKKFEKLIDKNAYEVKEIHPFFEKFPWILDPRINMFRHELQYAKILKENYFEEKLEDKNRRIDFLCTSVSNHKFIIELKKPLHKITIDDINQAKDYRSFIEAKIPNDKYSPKRVIAYVVGGEISDDRKTADEIDSMATADKVYVKTFHQLLTDASNYHQEFIERYQQQLV